jgi:hypothetical protein
MDISPVESHRGTYGSGPKACRQGNFAFDRKQRGSAWPRDRVLVDLTMSKLIRREDQPLIPKGARAQDCSVRLFDDLPVEPAQRLQESRLARRRADFNRTTLDFGDAAHELIEDRPELDRHASFDMPFEQEQEAKPGDCERRDDGSRAGGEQPEPERAPPHATACSGTR